MNDDERIQKIYNLLNKNPQEIYDELYNMRGITIKNKIAIISKCLNDQKNIDLYNTDPNSRKNTIYKAGKSLQELMAKNRLKNE